MELNKEYWKERYQTADIGWDARKITTPIKEYVDGLLSKDLKILIPGCGNAYEAIYLHQAGFKQVYVCDWAEEPLANLLKDCPSFPKEHLLCVDFFELQEKDFDLIIEQTFFCALDPSLRVSYAKKMSELLAQNGQLVGLLFDFPLSEQGPPFGGSKEAYEACFAAYFSKVKIEPCYNSIKPRMGSEYFICLEI